MDFNRVSSVSLKLWIVLSVILMTVCLVLVMTLSSMARRVVVLPQLFSPDTMRFGQFIEATNMGAPVKEKKLIDEMLIRFYVENRHFYIPDGGELTYRYGGFGPVGRLSTPGIYGGFIRSKGNFLENLPNETGTTSVDITHVERVDNTFTVDFDVYRYDKGQQMFAGSRRATVKVGYSPVYRSFRKDFANPYGLFVHYYEESGLKKR